MYHHCKDSKFWCQKLLWHCGQEFNDLDMVINAKKNLAVCVLALGMIGIVKNNHNGWSWDGEIPWVDEIRYLDIFIVRSTKFKCSVDHAKCSFSALQNGIFAKVGRLASEEVVLELLKRKCLPVLLYGEVYALDKRALQSLDFASTRFFYEIV